MTIKIEREKAIELVGPALLTADLYGGGMVDALAALGLIEFVEPKSAEDAAREFFVNRFAWGDYTTEAAFVALKDTGIGFTFTGESK